MKNSRMNTKVNALIKKVEGVQTQTVEILGRLKAWKSYPNECASSDSVIEKALNDITELWKNVAELSDFKKIFINVNRIKQVRSIRP